MKLKKSYNNFHLSIINICFYFDLSPWRKIYNQMLTTPIWTLTLPHRQTINKLWIWSLVNLRGKIRRSWPWHLISLFVFSTSRDYP